MDYHDPRSTTGMSYTVLERCIEDVLAFIKPLESDRGKRLNVIAEIASSIQSIVTLKDATVKPFGSFVSNLYSKWGDLDISITLDQHLNSSVSRRKKQIVLREIMKTLRKKGIGRNFQFIPQARVPLLVYESSLYGISCDLSVDNHQGRVKSKILELVTSFDERFTDMVLLIKEWAKAQNINDSKTGTLNSFSLCLLVIFHLQTCEPPILPPLKEIYDGNICDDVEGVDAEREKGIENVCALNVQKIISRISSQRNQSSLTDLLVSFFDKFSEIETFSPEYVICTFTGRWERMTSNPRWTEKSYSLYIEDPFEQPDNTARAVGLHDLTTIAEVFHMTRQLLSSSSVLSDRNSLLHLLSRPLVSSRLSTPAYNHQQANLHQYPNTSGNQQSRKPSGCYESSLNHHRTTRIGTTRKGYAGPKQVAQLANGNNLSQKSNQSDKRVDYVLPFRVAENHVHNPNLNHNYTIGFSGLNHSSQPANGNNPSQSKLGKKSVEYCVPSFQAAEVLLDSKPTTHSHRNQVQYSAQNLHRAGQDYTMNLSETCRTMSPIIELKHDNLAINHRNNQTRLAGQTPERFGLGHNSGPHGVYSGMMSGEPSNDPIFIRNHPLVGYSTTPTGSINWKYDASMKEINGTHTSGLAIVEPTTEQASVKLNGQSCGSGSKKDKQVHMSGLANVAPITEQSHNSVKLIGRSHGSGSKKGKQVWQPKAARNQAFL